MPRNKIGGKGHKRGKNTRFDDKVKEVHFAKKEEGEVYGQVVRRLGEKHILFACSDGKQRTCIIPGKFYKKVWMNKGDIVLIDTKAKGDDDVNGLIVDKYDHAGIRLLKSRKEIDFDCEEEGDDLIDDNPETNTNIKQHKISNQPDRYSRDIDTYESSDEEDDDDDEDNDNSEPDIDDVSDSDDEEETITENPKNKTSILHHGYGKETRNPRDKKRFDRKGNKH